MENTQEEVITRLESAAAVLERALARLDERQISLSGEVEKISATVESAAADRREAELEEKLATAEAELKELKAATAAQAPVPATRRRTAVASEMLAKHGISGEGPWDVRQLDEALKSVGIEQRIAIKSQLARAGAVTAANGF